MRGTSGPEMAAVVGGLYADRTVGGGASFQNCSATKKIKKKVHGFTVYPSYTFVEVDNDLFAYHRFLNFSFFFTLGTRKYTILSLLLSSTWFLRP